MGLFFPPVNENNFNAQKKDGKKTRTRSMRSRRKKIRRKEKIMSVY